MSAKQMFRQELAEVHGLTPAQIAAQQAEAEARRQRNRQWSQAEQARPVNRPAFASVLDLWPKGK